MPAERPSTPDETSLDELFALLANERRRRIVYFFEQSDVDVRHLDDLAEAVSWETAGSESEVRTELHHVHLPKLAAFGAVTYDAQAGTVRYEGDPRLRRCLMAVKETGRA